MKRRKFIQNLGLGAAPIALNAALLPESDGVFPTYNYTQPKNLGEAVSENGEILIRFEFTADGRIASDLKSKISIKNGNISRSKTYFFEQVDDEFISDSLQTSITQSNGDTDVLVLWLDEFSEKTEFSLNAEGGSFSFLLGKLVKDLEATGNIGETKITANFLLDKEIGELDPSAVGIEDAGDDFTFVIMSDPQGGDPGKPEELRTRMKIHNAFVEESVRLANEIKVKPAFCIMLGDIVDHQGEARDFAQMANFFSKLKMPVLYEMGNHESRYRAQFGPGYNFSEFNNYFAAQKAMNGMDYLLYSFNMGQWHFVVWPDPLRNMFWENHPHYFDWLERDLEKHKTRPTLFLQHIPMHPIGINPLVNYAESVSVKRLLFQILSKHGNVKNIFSGHVHIPVKASVKTAAEHKGINCINLPAAGYRPRAFGEQDYYGGPSQGIAIIELKGDKLAATYKTVTLEEYNYPEKLTPFDDKKYPLWFNYKWELPAVKQIQNGSFEQGLENWGQRFVYHEDAHPANVCKAVKTETGKPALYLKMKRRGYMAPGQDRLPQDINRIFQAVELEPGKNPLLRLQYKVDEERSDFDGYCGAYIWVEGYQKSVQVVNLIYFLNKAWVNMGGTYGRNKGVDPVIFSLDKTPGKWHNVQLNIKNDFEKNHQGMEYNDARPDRLIISAGTWTVNDGAEQPFAAWFTG
ncbi:MAG TPA: metallophosphoesterase, partial [Prolixibacteraceae bacterium]|nr:metallophosphoesterase [Prolixibacteraceae bacterium]